MARRRSGLGAALATGLTALSVIACTLTTAPNTPPRVSATPLTSADSPTPPPTRMPPASPAAFSPTPPPAATVSPAPPAIPDQVAAIDAARLIDTVNRLASLGNRHVLSAPAQASGIQAAGVIVFAEFLAIQQAHPARSIQVIRQPFTFPFAGQETAGENIVLVIPGSDPGAGAIVIGAHYDTISGDATAANDAQPGADDNASGVAAVIEIARVLAIHPHRATIYCVLFSAEEEGRFGSLAFVQDTILAHGVPLRAMINLDMIGVPVGPDGVRRDDELRVYSAPPDESPSRQLAALIAQAAQTYVPGMTVTVYETLDRAGRWGDHQSFSDAGYAAVRLIEPDDDPARMHNALDLPDSVDAPYLRRVTQVALAAALLLAD